MLKIGNTEIEHGEYSARLTPGDGRWLNLSEEGAGKVEAALRDTEKWARADERLRVSGCHPADREAEERALAERGLIISLALEGTVLSLRWDAGLARWELREQAIGDAEDQFLAGHPLGYLNAAMGAAFAGLVDAVGLPSADADADRIQWEGQRKPEFLR